MSCSSATIWQEGESLAKQLRVQFPNLAQVWGMQTSGPGKGMWAVGRARPGIALQEETPENGLFS